MRIHIQKDTLQIVGNSFFTNEESAFIEYVLGLKKDGDSVELIRRPYKDSDGDRFYLETRSQKS